jgi:hypothetical protein
MMVKYGEWDQLSMKKVDPRWYSDAEGYWRDAAAVSYLRKLEELPTSFDRKAKAHELFFACEAECYRTNERLSPFLYGAHRPEEDGVVDFISTTKKYIRSWLRRPPIHIEGRFGPGATYGDKGKLSTVPDKMSSRPTLTASALGFLFPWASTMWATACAVDGRSPEFVSGNRFTTVPKDSSKYRGIAVEPSINLFYQLGLGRELKRRLLQSGIDLKEGQAIHKRVACESSLDGRFATLDLSNASDTISKNLVKLLLPDEWFELLDALRSPTTKVAGKTVRLEKFSSMGNGFTFELETLIFLGICAAAMEGCGLTPVPGGNVFVYGDDIIIPTECSSVVISALRFFGMTLNEGKSFVDGPFRESCGGDYFKGVDVRPFFLKENPNEPQELIAMANGIRRMARANDIHLSRSGACRRAWFSVLDAIPTHIRRLRGPEDLGDLVVHDDEAHWSYRWRHSIRYIKCYRPARFVRVGWEHFKPDVVLASALYGAGDGLLGITPRDSVAGHKVGWVPFS